MTILVQGKPFIILCDGVQNEKQNQRHAVAYPLHIPEHTISGYHPVKVE